MPRKPWFGKSLANTKAEILQKGGIKYNVCIQTGEEIRNEAIQGLRGR